MNFTESTSNCGSSNLIFHRVGQCEWATNRRLMCLVSIHLHLQNEVPTILVCDRHSNCAFLLRVLTHLRGSWTEKREVL